MLNIKSHKKIGLHPLSEECMFGKTTEGGGGGQIDLPSAFLGLVNLIKNLKSSKCELWTIWKMRFKILTFLQIIFAFQFTGKAPITFQAFLTYLSYSNLVRPLITEIMGIWTKLGILILCLGHFCFKFVYSNLVRIYCASEYMGL